MKAESKNMHKFKSYGRNKIDFKMKTIYFLFYHDLDQKRPLLGGGGHFPLEFRAHLYIFGISGVKGSVKHTIQTFDFLPPPPQRDCFKKKLMEFSIKLPGWVLDAPVFH